MYKEINLDDMDKIGEAVYFRGWGFWLNSEIMEWIRNNNLDLMFENKYGKYDRVCGLYVTYSKREDFMAFKLRWL